METLFQDLIHAFGWSILNSIWQGGIIYGLLFITLLSAPKISARKRHNLSYLSLCGIFIWFVITFFNHINWSAAGNPTTHFSMSVSYFRQMPLTFSEQAELYFPFILSLYGIGILIQIFILSKGYIVLKRLKTSKLTEVSPQWLDTFNTVYQSLGLKKTVLFRMSGIVKVPVVVGYLKPVVLFPVCLCNQLDMEQVEAILIHELSHIRRNDYLLNLIKTSIETFMFFNPFIWLTGRFIQIEREHACDDLVVQLSNKPLTYAHALLKLEMLHDQAVPAYAMAATGSKQYLYQRIKRITNMKTNYLNVKQQLAALTLAFAGLVSVAWVNPEVKATAIEVTNKIKESSIFTAVDIPKPEKTELVVDTTKKRQKIKITITDGKGLVKEYNSLDQVPDSIKHAHPKLFSTKMNFQFGDSLKFFRLNDSVRIAAMGTSRLILENNLASAKFVRGKLTATQLELKEKLGELAKTYNSKAFKDRFISGSRLMAKRDSMFKHNQGLSINKIMVDGKPASISFESHFDKRSGRYVDSTTVNGKAMNTVRIREMMSNLPSITIQGTPAKISNIQTIDLRPAALRNSPEYKKLREKFDKDVAELLKKTTEENNNKNN